MRKLILALFLTAVATCGQKGPLELPDRNAGGTENQPILLIAQRR